jgi:uncharacterized membrane protein required for colicin V production
VTRVDWIAVGFVALTALIGFRKGLVASLLSVVGIVAGAVIGARVAPHLLSHGSSSRYTPLVALAGAVILAATLEALGSMAGSLFRQGLHFPPLRALDSAGGLVLGAATGLALVWVIGVVALLIPGQRELRQNAQRSLVLRRLNEIVSPSTLLHALAHVDPFPVIAGPAAPVAPPTLAILRQPEIDAAVPSVVRVLGTACGLGIAGSGWVVAPGVVVTAAHVVAGETDTVVVPSGSSKRLRARAIAFDSKNDLALLRVQGLRSPALSVAAPREGEPVAILGFPENGPLAAAAGRIGRTASVLAADAYGKGAVPRTVTSIGGKVRHGDSGAPAVDSHGRVESTIFAARTGFDSGFGVPSEIVRNLLAAARGTVSTGACAP